jgi:hypothetical protein
MINRIATGTATTNAKEKQKVVMDDIQVTLSSILSHNAQLEDVSQVSLFIMLLTRVSTMDHRALCIYILLEATSEAVQAEFVRQGGLRVLVRWLDSAIESHKMQEVKGIMKICRKFPDVVEPLIRAEISLQLDKIRAMDSVDCEVLQRKVAKLSEALLRIEHNI